MSAAAPSIGGVNEPRVARVAVDVPLPHLDRFFDYAIPDDMAQQVTPGCRVRVRFAGRQRDGYVIDVLASSDSDRELTRLLKVVSAEPVLRPEIVGVVRAVADHYAGTFADVVRLAVPPRHGVTEQAAPPEGVGAQRDGRRHGGDVVEAEQDREPDDPEGVRHGRQEQQRDPAEHVVHEQQAARVPYILATDDDQMPPANSGVKPLLDGF